MRAVLLLVVLVTAAAAAARGDRVLQEWRFDSPAALDQWTTNQDVADARIVDSALRLRISGPDPILVAKQRFDIAATPWQAIEVRMRTDRDGGMELFWSGTTQGKYGGFSQGKSTPFEARGDGQWHTYRLYPFWQSEGRIVQLRIDPYFGASFDIAWVRIVDAELGAVSPWRAASGVDVAPEASRLTLTDPDGFVLWREDADASQTTIVAVPVAAATGRQASIVFATDTAPGLHELSFPVEPGAAERTYNVDMLNSPDWRGRIVAIGVRPGERAGDSLTLGELRVSDRPLGPPQLRVLSFGVDEALPRAGVPFGVTARLTNEGGETARGVQPALGAPRGATIVGPARGAARDLLYGQEDEWHWTVRCARPTSAKLSLSVSSAGAHSIAAQTTARVTPRIVLPGGKVPAPKPVRGKIDVGVYYFPGWNTAARWAPIMRFPERRPVLGWYREGDPSIADWDVRWAVEHGITFFAYDWYWNQGARALDHALHQGLFHAKYRKLLKFCLLWANHNPPHTSSQADCVALTRYWIEHYFRQPEYYRIYGRPVVIIFSTYRLRDDLGSDGIRRAFDAMRAACREAGMPPVYLIACVYSAGDAELAAKEGYDAVTAYNWPGLGVENGRKRAPYADLASAYRRNWESIVQSSPVPLMVPISGGWDNRPWAGDAALVRYGRTPALFRKHLEDARSFIATHPRKTLPVALIEAWNELGEGSYIEPTRDFGFGYLDAIRDVFTDAPKRHVDLTPADTGVPAPQVEPAPPGQTYWAFARSDEGWTSMMNMTDARVVAGALRTDTTGDDPAFIGPPIQAGAGLWREVRVRMRLTALDGAPFDDAAQLFWATNTTGTSEAASVRVPIRADGAWHDLVLPVCENPRWRGIITSLRWDPCTRAKVRVEIQSIALVR